MVVMMYLVDVHSMYCASALASNTVMRSIAGAVLPLCGLDMYDALGLGWGNLLLGFIAIGVSVAPLIFWRYGERLRTHYEVSFDGMKGKM